MYAENEGYRLYKIAWKSKEKVKSLTDRRQYSQIKELFSDISVKLKEK